MAEQTSIRIESPLNDNLFGTSAQSARLISAPHPDFGEAVAVLNVMSTRGFRPVIPIQVTVYHNNDGFTGIVDQFDRIIGYGESIQDAFDEAQTHLMKDRAYYASLADAQCTPQAITYREKLGRYLEEV